VRNVLEVNIQTHHEHAIASGIFM